MNRSGTSSNALISNEAPPSRAFDRVLGGSSAINSIVQTTSTALHCDGINGADMTDCDRSLILEMPCFIHTYAYGITAGTGATSYMERAPGKAEMFSSSDGSTWTSFGEFDNLNKWSEGETKVMTMTDSTLGPFNYFKLTVKRRAGSETQSMTLSDIVLYATVSAGSTVIALPLSDIAAASAWLNNSSVLYEDYNTFYTDYAGSEASCQGRYHTMSEAGWTGINTPAAAFDKVIGSTPGTYFTSLESANKNSAVSCDQANDPQSNTLGSNLQRVNTSQTGNTADTATFTYTCDPGYALDSAAAVTFSCTGDSASTSALRVCTTALMTELPILTLTAVSPVPATRDTKETASLSAPVSYVKALGTAALETLDAKLAACIALAPTAEKEAIAVDSAKSSVVTVSTLLVRF
uniref:Uncharacterized protein n=1 Tax=Chromera velia CCMP2878 TaxID=1169474 RepID=A0A0G4FT61_9ALVE|eukprot:Cvel_18616.t1-p1 / transcript=Cvel_18616.t1 / gene=Cvel_18616 / organism=Chromera_velia_CCMP2878 / gene_product=Serine-rich adhesin for platelets, putative / transcript_product=Serine-rich adhesin for platelets, putative / location=Cvel_scaffold1554:4385-13631(+) / protein_length=407 / sequence_SO=supercontig / SO=protein_coding / is_pseudo=false